MISDCNEECLVMKHLIGNLNKTINYQVFYEWVCLAFNILMLY